eukprot:206381_1
MSTTPTLNSLSLNLHSVPMHCCHIKHHTSPFCPSRASDSSTGLLCAFKSFARSFTSCLFSSICIFHVDPYYLVHDPLTYILDHILCSIFHNRCTPIVPITPTFDPPVHQRHQGKCYIHTNSFALTVTFIRVYYSLSVHSFHHINIGSPIHFIHLII